MAASKISLLFGHHNTSPLPSVDMDIINNRLYPNRTTDPEAQNWQNAVEMGIEGLLAARREDFVAAAHKIAGAFLLDRRSMDVGITESHGRVLVINEELLSILRDETAKDPQPGSKYASEVITLLRTYVMKAKCQERTACQEITTRFVLLLQKILEDLKDSLLFESNESVCAGYLTRARLRHYLGFCYVSLGNFKKAFKQFSVASTLDPSNLENGCA